MAQVEIKVLRRQDAGDRIYEIGEKRRVDQADAKRLVDSGSAELTKAKAPAKKAAK